MKKFLFILMSIFLTSCASKDTKDLEASQEVLAPIQLNNPDYDSFTLKGQTYKLPLSFDELRKNGFTINENEYYHPSINKSQQVMVNLKADGADLGASFKNQTDGPINTEDGTIIELYINNQDGNNDDFSIHGLEWGTSFQEASENLDDLNLEEAATETERTLNYYTDDNLVSLYFSEDKLNSAAIFSKSFMRDENYVGGEFVIFGQTVKFPLNIKDLEELLSSDFDMDENEGKSLEPGEEVAIKLYSPMFDNPEDKNESSGLDFHLKNTSDKQCSYEDAEIIKIVADNSSDLSVGNVYVGASVDELKRVDKKNQNPRRLKIDGKNEEGVLKMTFTAENDTNYIFQINDQVVNHIEIVNKKEQEWNLAKCQYQIRDILTIYL